MVVYFDFTIPIYNLFQFEFSHNYLKHQYDSVIEWNITIVYFFLFCFDFFLETFRLTNTTTESVTVRNWGKEHRSRYPVETKDNDKLLDL